MFESFASDLVIEKSECRKCLCEKKEYRNETNQERKKFTVLFLKPSARCRAASSPISGLPMSVLLMSSVLSVYVEK